MKQNKLLWLTAVCSGLLFSFTACDSDNENDPKPEKPVITEETKGAYILNNGTMGSNNSSIYYYDVETKQVTNRVFEAANLRGLGDTAQDMIIYGNKAYIAVYGSNRIEVVDKNTMKEIAHIDPTIMVGGGETEPQAPRTLIAHNGSVFATLFDGHVISIDTATLEIKFRAQTGNNPEYMTIANNRLYVANSGGMNYPNYDKTVSVFNLVKLSSLGEIPVLDNPVHMCSDSQGDVYVISMGNYGDIPNTLQRIPAGEYDKSEIVQDETGNALNATIMTIQNDTIYAVYSQWGNPEINYIKFDAKNETVITKSFITDDTKPVNPYSISVDPLTGNVYIGDSPTYGVNGDIYIYNPEGKLVDKFEAGTGPLKVCFLTNK